MIPARQDIKCRRDAMLCVSFIHYIVPIEFIRHKKDNLVFKIYPDYNHSFAIPPHNNNEKGKQCFMDVFEEFVKFVEQ